MGVAGGWITAPLIGGVIAAVFLAIIKAPIINQEDRLAAARRWVPVFIAFMAGAFATQLAIKGVNRVVDVELGTALLAGVVVLLLTWWLVAPVVARQSAGMQSGSQSVRELFVVPLICSAALLSFVHGANDVANAVGPLAAMVHAVSDREIASSVSITSWTMVIGALGISAGLPAARSETDTHGRTGNHSTEPDACLLCGTVCRRYGHRRFGAWTTGQFDTCRRLRGFRGWFLSGMVHRKCPAPAAERERRNVGD